MERDSAGYRVPTTYAGFWLRGLASLVDTVLLLIPPFVVLLVLFWAAESADDLSDADTAIAIAQFVYPIFGYWLYFAILESSTWQATIGKRLFNIRVTDLHGRQISFARATGRHFGRMFPP